MSGHPYTYGRGMAIAQLMKDMRRPALQAIVKKNKEWHELLIKRRDESGLNYHVFGPHGPTTVYLYGGDLFTSCSDTIDWVPKLQKLTKFGRHECFLTAEQIATETDDRKQFPMWYSKPEKPQYNEPIEGWPTEAEIAAEIAESAEREKQWRDAVAKDPGYLGLSLNDFDAMKRTIG